MEFEAGVGCGDLGVVFVDEVVVLGTEEAEVVDVGGSATFPPFDVVDLAPLWSRPTGDTALIPGDHRYPLCGCGES